MKVLRVYIIDDSITSIEVLEKLIQMSPDLMYVGYCQYPEEAAKKLLSKEIEVDLLFVDIKMKPIDGVQFAEILGKLFMIIFTTAYPKFAARSYEIDAVEYLLKPITKARFLESIHKAIRRKSELEKKVNNNAFTIRVEGRTIEVVPSEIIYLESMENYVKIMLHDVIHVVRIHLKDLLEQELAQSSFQQIHRSFAINLNWLDKVRGDYVFMKNGKDLPIGRKFKSKLGDRLNSRES
jgi:DNA-binding LytR/AlgR family response regulator